MTEGVFLGSYLGGTPSVSAGGAASSLREGALGFCSAASPSRVAPAKRGAGRFVNGQTPAQSKIAWEVIPGFRQSFRRAPVFSLPPCTAHSLFSQKKGPRKIVDFVGRGGRNGAGAVLAARRGRSRAEFLPTKWGVHWTCPQRAVDLPARQGV